MSEEQKSMVVARFWVSKHDDGTIKGYSGSFNVAALGEFTPDEYGNVRVWVTKNNKRPGKKDCDLIASAFFDDGSERPAKKTYSKPAQNYGGNKYGKKSFPKKEAPKPQNNVEDSKAKPSGDSDFLD